MIAPTGIHFLLTYRCLLSCQHCFVWGDPAADLTFTVHSLEQALQQLRAVPSVEWVYFEGGEPFLYYPLLRHAVELASAAGYRVGIVSNGYWAQTPADAVQWLRPFAGLVHELSISTDLFHSEERISEPSRHALKAADELGIPADTIICEREPGAQPTAASGEPVESGGVMYRGRAAVELAARAPSSPWQQFDECPHERLADPNRVHIDPLGEVHLCQGLSLGNLFQTPLAQLFSDYRPVSHPVVSSLLAGGPAELVRRFGLPAARAYADACHLCYQARRALRPRFPEVLTPGYMYGEYAR